jgi:hypothetical protein
MTEGETIEETTDEVTIEGVTTTAEEIDEVTIEITEEMMNLDLTTGKLVYPHHNSLEDHLQ